MKSSKEQNRFEDMMQYYSSRRGGQERGDRAERKEKVTEYLKNLNLDAKKKNAKFDGTLNDMFNQGKFPHTHKSLNSKFNEASFKNLNKFYEKNIEKCNSEYSKESNNFEETEDNSRNNEFNKRLSEYNISDDDKEVNIAEDTFYIKSLPSQQRSAIFKILDEASKNLIDSSSNNNKGTNDKESSMNNTPSKLSKNFEKEEIKSLSSKCNNNNNNEIESSSYLKQSTSESITFDEETNKNSSINDNNSEIANNSVEYLSRVERESILRKALLNGTLLEKYEEIAAGSTCRLKSNTTSSIDPVKPIMERLKKLNDLKKKHCYIEDSSGNESKSRPQYKTKKKVVVKPYGVSTGKNKLNTKSILSKSILAKHFMKYVDDIKD